MTAPPRPHWARRLDRWTLRLARVVSPLLGRPSDALLTRLAKVDRPAPPIAVPTPEELGVVDHLAEGRRALGAGMYAEALFHFGERLSATSGTDAAWAWHGRGDALQLMGQSRDALVAYEQAVQLAPGEGLHHLGRANALDSLDRPTDANAATRTGLKLDPTLTWMRPAPPEDTEP